MFARRKRKEKLILIVVNLLIVDNILLFYKLINADKCINEHGLYKYQEQCHKYPNEIIKGIVQSNKTLEQISNEHNPLRLNNVQQDNNKLAILVPYRDREMNLRRFLNYMHTFLSSQLLTYQIFLIEPYKTNKFNRGLLANIGYIEALKKRDFDCFILHDVDLIPENMENRYVCNKEKPLQMSISISIYKYLKFRNVKKYFLYENNGGVTAYTKEQFKKINGYSNLFFGWGGEDDDVALRINQNFGKIERRDEFIGVYFALCHEEDVVVNHNRVDILKSSKKRFKKDGVNNSNYRLLETIETNLFTKFIVEY